MLARSDIAVLSDRESLLTADSVWLAASLSAADVEIDSLSCLRESLVAVDSSSAFFFCSSALLSSSRF